MSEQPIDPPGEALHSGDRVLYVKGKVEKLSPAVAAELDRLERDAVEAAASARRSQIVLRVLLLVLALVVTRWAADAANRWIRDWMEAPLVVLWAVTIPPAIFYRRQENRSFRQWFDSQGIMLCIIGGMLAFAATKW